MNESRVPALDQVEGAGGDTSGDQEASSGAPRPKRRRRRRSGRRPTTQTESTDPQSEEKGSAGDTTQAVRVVRRRRRVDPVAAPEAPADGAADGSVARTGPAGGQRRRRSRGGRSRGTPSAKGEPAAPPV